MKAHFENVSFKSTDDKSLKNIFFLHLPQRQDISIYNFLFIVYLILPHLQNWSFFGLFFCLSWNISTRVAFQLKTSKKLQKKIVECDAISIFGDVSSFRRRRKILLNLFFNELKCERVKIERFNIFRQSFHFDTHTHTQARIHSLK